MTGEQTERNLRRLLPLDDLSSRSDRIRTCVCPLNRRSNRRPTPPAKLQCKQHLTYQGCAGERAKRVQDSNPASGRRSSSLLSPPVQSDALTRFELRDITLLRSPHDLSRRQKQCARLTQAQSPRGNRRRQRSVVEAMKLASTPLGIESMFMRDTQEVGRNGLRQIEKPRPAAGGAQLSLPSLRIEFCVLYVHRAFSYAVITLP